MPRLGAIWPTVLKDGEIVADGCGALLSSAGMTRGGERGVDGTVGLAAPKLIVRPAPVPKLCQNPIYLAGKGINFERKQNPRNHVSTWEEKG
jgi:hypothetical protein